MKKLLTLTAACALLTAPATAVQKCVALKSNSACSFVSGDQNAVDWTSSCSGVTVKGVAVCAANVGSTVGDLANTLTLSSNNVYCWCKMISPVTSLWTFYNSFSSAADCMKNCAYNCSGMLTTGSNFRPKMFSTLSD